MKKLLWILLLLPLVGVTQEAYKFTDTKVNKITSIKNQSSSGTCWSFSVLAMLEAEIIRAGGEEMDLSEMYVVRKTYEDKSKRFVRMHGKQNYGGGGGFGDLINIWKKYGLMPEKSYEGLDYSPEKKKHNHYEMDAVMKSFVETIITNPSKEITPAWQNAMNGILDAYLGEVPEKFTYDSKEVTAEEFGKNYVEKLNPEDYIMISSYTHHQPFYQQFALEVEDNWNNDLMYNVPMEELFEITETAVNNGYTVAWAADVSDKGFSWNNGIAVLPETDLNNMAGTEREKWEGLTARERMKKLYNFSEIAKERTITQADRQEAFDNYSTTDDHGMLIFGTATDQNGNAYFKVKNSWGETGKYKGYLYCSETFFKYKTMDIMIHKDALSKSMKKKLGIK